MRLPRERTIAALGKTRAKCENQDREKMNTKMRARDVVLKFVWELKHFGYFFLSPFRWVGFANRNDGSYSRIHWLQYKWPQNFPYNLRICHTICSYVWCVCVSANSVSLSLSPFLLGTFLFITLYSTFRRVYFNSMRMGEMMMENSHKSHKRRRTREREREIHSLIKALTNLANKLVMRSLYHVLDINVMVQKWLKCAPESTPTKKNWAWNAGIYI